ncbi:fibronectin type III domain-containing protein [Aquimarina mytili]|uniref:Fibronectin type-III domain-containing protein n=1 Tax=Aquimarina mytili TaxID=874423 RepID=A0A936ZYF9_9FLAO|nr:hypothetical protein [Aquimarina mytili]MBL0684195.1 hypothetical protein [Aquimarina mytili]
MKKLSIYLIGLCISFCTLFSCEEVLFEEDLTDKRIVLIAPTDSTTVRNTSVAFSWEAVDLATNYRLQVAQPNFENASQVVLDTTIVATSFTASLLKNEYQWRVRAQNPGSVTPYTTAMFTVIESEDFSSTEVILIAPMENEITNTANVDLQWQSITDAKTYRIQLLNNSDQVIQEEATTTTSISVTFPEGVTKWQVRAENDTQSTLYTTRTLTLDSMAPNQPVAVTPANNATQSDTVVSFSWTREAVAGTTEIDSIYVYKDVALTELATKDEVTSPSDITLETGTTYFWFIKAFDQAGNESDPSDVSRFTIN